MKRNLKVKMGEQKLREEWDRLNAKYKKTKSLLDQAMSHCYRLERAVKLLATREGTCWCGVASTALEFEGERHVFHTVACDQLYLALYGAERGE